jgi:Phospholipase_D-nuclease N-terminal
MMHILLAASPRTGPSDKIFIALLPVVVLAVAFDAYCLVDLIRAKSVRHLPKWAWGLIIVLLSAPWGGLIYLFAGRDRGQRRPSEP